ncbi:hypothetical protein C6401_10770 [Arthrobacter woluwensis]|uniref:hypothetical protein n=1 Tax=Arthrobacter woluwensis TaxID=156980 RepID=UPI000D13108E|nr:hypothetical protein [Arthrobacter woluwensis]PSS43607.1 hypothetical protein C6401_10770 [Arthrobacter woluwensis]
MSDIEQSLDERPYITITNQLLRHPKFKALPSDKARLYLLELWAHCNEFLTDGLVTKEVLYERGPGIAKALIAGNWVLTTNDPNVFEMRDYLKHQKSRETINKLIAKRREAGSKGGKIGMHNRHHVAKGVFKEGCEYCENPT